MREIDLQTELNALDNPFELLGYVKAPPYPYGVYTDDIDVRVSDEVPAYTTTSHDVIIEIYHSDPTQLKSAADLIQGWLKSKPLSYKMTMRYTPSEDHYFATFTFSYTTKRKGGTS